MLMEKYSAEEINSPGEIEFAKEKNFVGVLLFSNSVGEENFHEVH